MMRIFESPIPNFGDQDFQPPTQKIETFQTRDRQFALSKKQRLFIKIERDGGQCQFPPHLNGSKRDCLPKRLEVHHILPQRYCERLGINPDYPENVLTVCRNAHHKIHPDMGAAIKDYAKQGLEAIKNVFKSREAALDHHQVYWDGKWDRPMSAQAVKLTQKSRSAGKKFPF
jgi:hypothetical protein